MPSLGDVGRCYKKEWSLTGGQFHSETKVLWAHVMSAASISGHGAMMDAIRAFKHGYNQPYTVAWFTGHNIHGPRDDRASVFRFPGDFR